MNAVTRNALVLLVMVVVGVVAASSQVPTQTPFTGSYSDLGALGTAPSLSPDLLAYLAFLSVQERMHADGEARERQAAIERARHDVVARIRSAGMAQYEAEAARRRADFSREQARLAAEAESRIESAAAELAEIRRAAEEDAVRAAGEKVVARVRAFKVDWDVAQETAVTAMALQRSQDLANVEKSRGFVRVNYAPDPTREARWIRASAWSAAEREVRERTTQTRVASDRKLSEASFQAQVRQDARLKLQARVAELRRRDEAVIARVRQDAERDAKAQADDFALAERALRAEAVAGVEREVARLVQGWARSGQGHGDGLSVS